MSVDTIHISFTGTQTGMVKVQKTMIKLAIHMTGVWGHPLVFHHGDCIGADSDFHDICAEFYPQFPIEIHPPTDPKKRAFREGSVIHPEKPYMERNQDMVDIASKLLATPKDMVKPTNLRGQGTWATVNRAQKANKSIFIAYLDGTCDYW